MARRARHGLGATPVLVVLTVVLSLGVLLVAPTPVGAQFRSLVHFHQPQRVLPAVEVPARRGRYTFEHTQSGTGDPVAYSPCRPIPYVVDPHRGPRDALAFIRSAVAAISRASGLAFEYRGTTTDTGFEHRTAGDPVLIGFVAPGAIKGMSVESGHIGLGGSTAYEVALGRSVYRTGMVALRSDWFDSPTTSTAEKRAVVMHELGHVLGLGHVSDPRELMNAENVGLTSLGPGDRRGLALLGRGPCL